MPFIFQSMYVSGHSQMSSSVKTELLGMGTFPIFPGMQNAVTVGTWAWTDDANKVFSGEYYNTSHNVNDQAIFSGVYLKEGDYRVDILTTKFTNRGIISLWDGDPFFGGTKLGEVDTYSGFLQRNNKQSITFSMSSSGTHILYFAVLDKNALSTDHYVGFTYMVFYKTG